MMRCTNVSGEVPGVRRHAIRNDDDDDDDDDNNSNNKQNFK
jgi:hypothetical protein